VNRLRNRLILVFLAAILAPLAATIWITTSFMQQTIDSAAIARVGSLSKSLQTAGHDLYQRAKADLQKGAKDGSIAPTVYDAAHREVWPVSVKEFFTAGDHDAFSLAGPEGNRLDYLVRDGERVQVYSTKLGDTGMNQLDREIRDSGSLVRAVEDNDIPRGFRLTYLLLAAMIWIVALIALVYIAGRISHPIQSLTAGLGRVAAGDLTARVPPSRDDEVGNAILAFNHMADRLQETTERLVTLRQLAGWQMLARKMAHEVKNSLTPIRLTVEEMLARHDDRDRAFVEQATQIVVDEIETLERRIRAFSQFAAEPPVKPAPLDVNALVEERVAFLKTSHPEVSYECKLGGQLPHALADPDLVKGILTNLLENAAEAAGSGGRILGTTAATADRVAFEVHDSGPGLSEQARASLFQPTISFKKRGMGLGLSIARRSALLSGGDIVVVKGELGGAGFRVLLPVAADAK
jgi:nitrogen fixation/metabolism regulation signal transduction histidine kinase